MAPSSEPRAGVQLALQTPCIRRGLCAILPCAVQVTNDAVAPPRTQLAEVRAISGALVDSAAQQLGRSLPEDAALLPPMLAHNLHLHSRPLPPGWTMPQPCCALHH